MFVIHFSGSLLLWLVLGTILNKFPFQKLFVTFLLIGDPFGPSSWKGTFTPRVGLGLGLITLGFMNVYCLLYRLDELHKD